MSIKSILSVSILISVLLLSACKKDDKTCESRVDIFFIQDYDILFFPKEHVDSIINAFDEPFIAFEDLISYDPATHVFQVSDNGIYTSIGPDNKELANGQFYVKVNNKILYHGVWTTYSHLYMDTSLFVVEQTHYREEKQFRVAESSVLFELDTIDDVRNDQKLIIAFDSKNKLL